MFILQSILQNSFTLANRKLSASLCFSFNFIRVRSFHKPTNQPTNRFKSFYTLHICTFIQLYLLFQCGYSIPHISFLFHYNVGIKKTQRAVDQWDSFYFCFINSFRLWLRFGFTAILCFRAIDIRPIIIVKFRSYRIH